METSKEAYHADGIRRFTIEITTNPICATSQTATCDSGIPRIFDDIEGLMEDPSSLHAIFRGVQKYTLARTIYSDT